MNTVSLLGIIYYSDTPKPSPHSPPAGLSGLIENVCGLHRIKKTMPSGNKTRSAQTSCCLLLGMVFFTRAVHQLFSEFVCVNPTADSGQGLLYA